MVLTLLVGSAGGFIGNKIRIPAGYLIGALIATAILKFFWTNSFVHSHLSLFVQIAAGSVLGAGIKKSDILALRSIIVPTVILIVGMIVMNVTIGFTIHYVSGIDIVTSLLASAPGGVTEMSLVAANMGGNPMVVAMIQLLRFMSVMSISPFVLKKLCDKSLADVPVSSGNNHCEIEASSSVDALKNKKILLTAIISLVAGALGAALPIPVGALMFSMCASAAINIFKEMGAVHNHQRTACQVIAGSLIGSDFRITDTLCQKEYLLAVFVLIIGVLILNILIGLTMSKFGKMDFPTALFASAPGGLSDMALISKDYGADQTKVVVMQLMRLICVIVLFPSVISVACTIFK